MGAWNGRYLRALSWMGSFIHFYPAVIKSGASFPFSVKTVTFMFKKNLFSFYFVIIHVSEYGYGHGKAVSLGVQKGIRISEATITRRL